MEELYSAKQDFLTNCYTRESINPYLEKLQAEHKAYNKEFSILLLDIDHFKSFNDKYGHLDGDEVLKYFSSSLRLGLAQIDSTIFRFGGDEFIIVFPEKNAREAYHVAVGLQDMLKSRPFLLAGKLLKMSFSGGIASGATDGNTPEKLVESADKAMYVSKKRGRARTTVYGKIIEERIKVIVLAAVIVLSVIAVASLSSFMKTGGRLLSSLPFGLSKPAGRPVPKAPATARPVSIRLKSGSVIRGRIVKETPHDVEVSLALEKGQGTITLRRVNIKSIVEEQ